MTGTFPPAICDVWSCYVNDGNSLVTPCGTTSCCDHLDGTTNCCDLGDGAACPVGEDDGDDGDREAEDEIDVMIFGESYDPATTTSLRVPPAPPTPGAPRDRSSASQGPQQ